MTKIKDLIHRNRTVRRFHQDAAIESETLKELVDLARLSPSGGNLQPLKYVLSNTPKRNAAIFPHLGWAGYLRDWGGPVEGERPAAYIVILGDTTICKVFGCDHGIAAQSILLGATERNMAGCIIGSIQREKLRRALEIPKHYEILLVLALGKPKEEVKLETVGSAGDVKYWRDTHQVHHVPKRALKEIIIA